MIVENFVFPFPELVLATHNPVKVRELGDLLAPYPIRLRSLSEWGFPEPQETGTTLLDNALLKASAAAEITALPCIADDSGIFVHDLNNAPGVYSADWAQKEDGTRDFSLAMTRVLRELEDLKNKTDRSAHFSTVLALVLPNGKQYSFEGRLDGVITTEPRGPNGFGYDPLFIPDGYDRTFGEMSMLEKESMSHRTQAFKMLVEFLRTHSLSG